MLGFSPLHQGNLLFWLIPLAICALFVTCTILASSKEDILLTFLVTVDEVWMNFVFKSPSWYQLVFTRCSQYKSSWTKRRDIFLCKELQWPTSFVLLSQFSSARHSSIYVFNLLQWVLFQCTTKSSSHPSNWGGYIAIKIIMPLLFHYLVQVGINSPCILELKLVTSHSRPCARNMMK